MLAMKEATIMRQKILRVIEKKPSTSHEIAERLRTDRQTVSNQLKRLRAHGVVRHDGDKSYPRWTVIENYKDHDGFVSSRDPDLKMKTADRLMGTPWQGMESFL